MKIRKRTQAAFAQPDSLVVAEEVGDDRDQDPDPDHEEEDLDDDQKQFAEGDVCKSQQGVDPFGGWNGSSGVLVRSRARLRRTARRRPRWRG